MGMLGSGGGVNIHVGVLYNLGILRVGLSVDMGIYLLASEWLGVQCFLG